MVLQNKLFIGGDFVDAVDGGTVASLNPHNNAVITEVAEAREADIDRAVAAAQDAFPAWARLSGMERGRLLLKLADAIEADGEALARLESLDTGHPLKDTRNLDVPERRSPFAILAAWPTNSRAPWFPWKRDSSITCCASRSASSARSCRGISR